LILYLSALHDHGRRRYHHPPYPPGETCHVRPLNASLFTVADDGYSDIKGKGKAVEEKLIEPQDEEMDSGEDGEEMDEDPEEEEVCLHFFSVTRLTPGRKRKVMV
jgi:hypothetical protein